MSRSAPVPGQSLHREAGAAAAGAAGIRVLDGEARADQLFGEVDDGVGKEGQGYLVDDHLFLPVGQDEVVLGSGVELDVVLEARTAATLDGHAQGLALCAGADLFKAGEGTVGDFGGKIHGRTRSGLTCAALVI